MVEIRRYPRLQQAREGALALAARDLAYTIQRERDEWLLLVDPEAAPAAIAEIEIFEAEERRTQATAAARTLPPLRMPVVSLFLVGLVMAIFFWIQIWMEGASSAWTELGVASSSSILRQGEWWRTITALTLHAGGDHFAANLASGLLFGAFLSNHFGSGLGWLLIVLGGAAGNAVNAWIYRDGSHFSIGASTAVFGALGLLVGAELHARWSHPGARSRWQLIVPLGAGFALLAFLGSGGESAERVDVLAHLWGFLCGVILGAIAAASRVGERRSLALQLPAGCTALLLLLVAWHLAVAYGKSAS